MAYVLYAAGSPLIVEYEEAILSCGGLLAAIVKNQDGTSLASDQNKLITSGSLQRKDFETMKFLIPLFAPGRRYAVTREIEQLAEKLGVLPTFGTLIHMSAIVAGSVKVSAGAFINAGVTVGAEAVIGEHCVVNRSASVGHHVELHPFVSVGPGATLAGQIRVGRGSVIGAGAVILPGTTIGENAVVAAGSVVTSKTVPSNVIVSGNPARPRGRPIKGYGKTSVPSNSGLA